MQLVLLLLTIVNAGAAQSPARQETALIFQGRPVVIYHPEQLDEFFSKGSASVCLQTEPSISPAKILVTADYEMSLNDGHHSAHRYFISTYVRQLHLDSGAYVYALADQYLTVKRYNLDPGPDIIRSERNEILRRVRIKK